MGFASILAYCCEQLFNMTYEQGNGLTTIEL